MQKTGTEGEQSAGASTSGKASWLLEGPNRIVLDDTPGSLRVYAHGQHVATLTQHVDTKDFIRGELAGVIYVFETLEWTHTGALLILQGAKVTDVLGPTLVLYRATHRPIWHPLPGADSVKIFVPLKKPEGMSAIEMFALLH